MLDLKLFLQHTYHLHDEIHALALELGVGLFVQDNDNISSRNSGLLIALTREHNFLFILHALVNVHLEC